MAHLATTYAAVSALVTVGGPDALSSINRSTMLRFLLRMKDQGGGFRMHDDGEVDVRGCYTALAVAHLVGLVEPKLVAGVDAYILSCQTYEGGLGGEPGLEAHGGYTYCGVAALLLAGRPHGLDLPRLLEWAAGRQGAAEGGFQGRTNKLVDGCYSFWQGSLFLLLRPFSEQLLPTFGGRDVQVEPVGSVQRDGALRSCAVQEQPTLSEPNREAAPCRVELPCSSAAALFPDRDEASQSYGGHGAVAMTELDPAGKAGEEEEVEQGGVDAGKATRETQSADAMDVGISKPLFNSHALQGYILICCQVAEGGLIDKPGKWRDYYHTCYCLSGLSCAQRCLSWPDDPAPDAIIGLASNIVEATEPLCNVRLDRYREARAHFASQTVDAAE